MSGRDPSPDVLAAIVAAVDVAWPRPAPPADPPPPAGPGAWRFSGRWWSRPTTARRDRPWIDHPPR